MNSLFLQILSWAITSALGAGFALLVTGAKGLRKRQDAMETGMRALLRSQLFGMHEKYVIHGEPCDYSAMEEATKLHDAYTALGGNGTGTRIYEEIMKKGGETE